MIDIERYGVAAATHPDMAAHYEQLAQETSAANEAWATHFAETYDVNPATAIAEAQAKVDAAYAEVA